MFKKSSILFIFIIALFFSLSQAWTQENSPRLLIHILDYLAQDYSGAVSHGKVINTFEYQEQTEFVSTALKVASQLSELKEKQSILDELKALEVFILSKEDPEKVALLARKIQAELINVSQIEMAPREWPNLSHGKILFEQNCTSCHGNTGQGDGPLAKGLTPPPANFLNETRMFSLSPFQLFNSIRLGIQGTPMPAFQKLSDQEIWELSFYLSSLRYQDKKDRVSPSSPNLNLQQLAKLSDASITEEYHLKGSDRESILAILRLQSPSDSSNTLTLAQSLLDEAQKSYLSGEIKQAKQKALIAYLEGVEPVEPRLRSLDSALVNQLEEKMAAIRTSIEQGVSVEILKNKIEEAKVSLLQADKILTSSHAQSQWFVFLMAFSIILREGFEAVLILVTILGVVKMLGAKRAVHWTHAGWIAALLCGVLAWIFSGYLLKLSGANRETMEGFTSLFAMVVLLYVGFWLHSKSEIGKWTTYIKKQMDSALQGSKLFGIGFISFLAVFREVFETVLFLRALWIEAGATEKTALLGGLAVAFVLIFILAYLLLKWSVKLPVARLFNLSSAVMAILAIILTGKGIHALQEAGYLSSTPFSISLKLPLLGLFPTLETLLPQVMILALIVLLWNYGKKSHQSA